MNPLQNHNIPWDLISGSFTGGLSSDEKLQLQQWLDSDVDHREKYKQLQDIWKNSTEDYKLYLLANEDKAWNALRPKLTQHKEAKIIKLSTYRTIQIAAAAVIFMLVTGIIYYLASKDGVLRYETAQNEQKQVELEDGTYISLGSSTKIEVSEGFNEETRTVKMIDGEASFTIAHHTDLPFIVSIGKVYVKDIGTVFTVKKSNEQVVVMVTEGIVTFNKQESNESKKLEAGTSLTYDIKNDSFTEEANNTAMQDSTIALNFSNTPLNEVLKLVQLKYGKTILMENDSIGKKKLTAQLEGIPYETALEVICKSLGLEYTVKDGTYTLREKR